MILLSIKQTPKQHLKLNSLKNQATLRLSWKKALFIKKVCKLLNKYFSFIPTPNVNIKKQPFL